MQNDSIPILTLRLELNERDIVLRPPLVMDMADKGVPEIVDDWLNAFLARGKMIDMLGGVVCLRNYLAGIIFIF